MQQTRADYVELVSWHPPPGPIRMVWHSIRTLIIRMAIDNPVWDIAASTAS
jgi:hypothetical protein